MDFTMINTVCLVRIMLVKYIKREDYATRLLVPIIVIFLLIAYKYKFDQPSIIRNDPIHRVVLSFCQIFLYLISYSS
jgi:hypothetical protein